MNTKKENRIPVEQIKKDYVRKAQRERDRIESEKKSFEEQLYKSTGGNNIIVTNGAWR